MTAYTRFEDLPRKHYGTILADPPWRFKAYAPPAEGVAGRKDTERHYQTMSIEEIKALPVRQIAAKDCYLMLWCSWPFLPQGLDVLKAWGFTYSSSFKVWMKLKRSFSPSRSFITAPTDFHTGTGYTTRKNSEFILLGRRGAPKRQVKNEHELLIAPVREHSRKPDETIACVERYAAGPYLEFFSRTERPGWDAFGDEITKFIDVEPPAPVIYDDYESGVVMDLFGGE